MKQSCLESVEIDSSTRVGNSQNALKQSYWRHRRISFLMRITKTRNRDNAAKCVGANGGEQKYIGTLGGGAGGFSLIWECAISLSRTHPPQ